MSGAGPSRRQFLAAATGGAALGATALGTTSSLRRFMPRAAASTRGVPDPNGFVITRWAADPFSLGSYSFIGVGASNDDRRALAAPVGDRLFFAGEATSAADAATVHGAYLSGRRAASELLEVARRGARVVVVGAGASGLAAARDLSHAGSEVVVVEGRDRIGGRIHTDRSLGIPLDLGASWIHGIRGNPIARLAREHGVPTRPTDYDNAVLYLPDGARATNRQVDAIYDDFGYVLDEIERPREQLDHDISLGSAIDAIVARDGDWTPADVMALDHAVNVNIEHEYAGDVNEMSLFWWDAGSGFRGGDVLFPETGYAWLPRLLAEGVDVRLGHRVRSIDWNDEGIRVTTGTEVLDERTRS